jgi:N utilization substance protein A
MRINPEEKFAEVIMKPDQVSLAIGKKGVNIKLAQELTGYEIEVFRDDIEETEYDIDLNEFKDEIDEWIIDSLKKAGCYTAKSVLALTDEEIMRRADLEDITVVDIKKILSAEFED